MSKRSTCIFSLLCILGLNLSSAVDVDFAPAELVDIDRILDVQWHEMTWFEGQDSGADDCGIYIFSRNDDGTINYEGSWWEYPTPEERQVSGVHATLSPSDFNGKLYIEGTDDAEAAILILAYASDYSWIVLRDNYNLGGVITVLSQTGELTEEAAVKGVELAADYGLGVRHSDILQDPAQCDFATLVDWIYQSDSF